MREIRFRGRCEKESRFAGQWVEGSLIQCEDGVTLIQRAFSDNCKITYHVEPDTVCQFTGLKDCEGKEVWEEDIVEFETYDLYKGIVERKAIIGYTGSGFFAIVDDIPYPLNSKCIKVIGNKFDKEK